MSTDDANTKDITTKDVKAAGTKAGSGDKSVAIYKLVATYKSVSADKPVATDEHGPSGRTAALPATFKTATTSLTAQTAKKSGDQSASNSFSNDVLGVDLDDLTPVERVIPKASVTRSRGSLHLTGADPRS